MHELIDVSDSEEDKTTVQCNASFSSHVTMSSSKKKGTAKVEENSESIVKCESLEVSPAIPPDLAREDSTGGHSKAVGQLYPVGEAVLKENGGSTDVKVMGVTGKSADPGLEDRIEIAEVMSLQSVPQSAAIGQCCAQRLSGEPLTRLVRGGEVEKESMEVSAAVVQPQRPDLCHSLQHLYQDHANSILEFSHKE